MRQTPWVDPRLSAPLDAPPRSRWVDRESLKMMRRQAPKELAEHLYEDRDSYGSAHGAYVSNILSRAEMKNQYLGMLEFLVSFFEGLED